MAVAEFPDLPSLIQSASNCTGQLAKGEHEVQLMRRICNTIQVCLKNGRSANFPDLKNQILRSRPACGAAAPFMHRFLMKFSMEATGLWDRVEQILRSSANSGRQLGADFFEALAADPRPATADSCIHLEIPLTHEIHHFLAGQIPLQVALCVAACAGGSKEQLEPSPKRAPSPPRGKFM